MIDGIFQGNVFVGLARQWRVSQITGEKPLSIGKPMVERGWRN